MSSDDEAKHAKRRGELILPDSDDSTIERRFTVGSAPISDDGSYDVVAVTEDQWVAPERFVTDPEVAESEETTVEVDSGTED